MPITVDTSSLETQIVRRMRSVGDAAVRRLARETDQRAPKVTRELVRSRRVRRTGSLSWRIEYTAPQGVWTDQGTQGPYVIRARNAKALRFVGRGGQVVFRRSVVHPGIVGTGWFSDYVTADRWADTVANTLRRRS